MTLSFNAHSSFAAEVLMIKWLTKAQIDNQFEKRLKKLYPGVKIKYIHTYRNKKFLNIILKSYDFSNVDLVYTFGTTGTKLVKDHLKGKVPHVFTAVSTPVLSGIVKSLSKPEGNITGGALLVDIETQIDTLSRLKKIKKLAVWFDPREKQSVSVLSEIVQATKARGIKVVPFRIIPDADKFSDMQFQASQQSNKLDALYFIMSASFHLHYKKLHSHLDPSLLVMGAIKHYVVNGSTIALGRDINEHASSVAELANRILIGESAGNIPVNLASRKKTILYVNRKKLMAAGINNPEKLGFQIIDIKKK